MINLVFILFIFLICGSVAFYLYKELTQYKYVDTYKFIKNETSTELKVIPKVIIQTYYDKFKIPNKVYENIQKYAPDYKHIIYDDKECIKFLTEFDKKFQNIKTSNVSLVEKFNSFYSGAHKADFFRYCYLYQHGGVYLDVKTELIKPLNTIITNDDTLYTCIARDKKTIYQGVIAVYPRHPLIGRLINQCIEVSNTFLRLNYSLFLQFFYKCIVDEIKSDNPKLVSGTYDIYNVGNIHLFVEDDCPISDCEGKTDRYNACVFIHDEYGNKVIKTRYSDFPWK
jgi:hypothetical protein